MIERNYCDNQRWGEFEEKFIGRAIKKGYYNDCNYSGYFS
jgi:tRNA(Glu) U13 pseudouridine synthase TruD